MARTRHLNGKVVYAEGFRPPEANQLFSTVGVEGNALLRPEMSRAVALELGATRAVEITYVNSGDVTGSYADVVAYLAMAFRKT